MSSEMLSKNYMVLVMNFSSLAVILQLKILIRCFSENLEKKKSFVMLQDVLILMANRSPPLPLLSKLPFFGGGKGEELAFAG